MTGIFKKVIIRKNLGATSLLRNYKKLLLFILNKEITNNPVPDIRYLDLYC